MEHADELADLVLRVARRLRQGTRDALAPLGLSPHQSRALRLIGERQPLRPSELAEHLDIAARSVTDVLDGLLDRGWIERSADPGDRRATLVSLTDSGRELLDRVGAVRRVEAERVFGSLDAGSRDALAGLLGRLDADWSDHPNEGQAAREG